MAGRVYSERDSEDPRIAWLVFEHLERRNAVSLEMWQRIPVLAAELEADPDVRVVVLRGAGELSLFMPGQVLSAKLVQRFWKVGRRVLLSRGAPKTTQLSRSL